MSAAPRILVAGIGNIFLGDDAFGVEVAQRLMARPMPPSVRVVDFGIRGLDLTYALLDECDVAILVDAIPRGGQPGTLYLVEPDHGDAPQPGPADLLMEGHSMDPAKVLRLVTAMGGKVGRVLLVGCEPTPPQEEMGISLSPPVQAAVEPAVAMVESLLAKLLPPPALAQ